jgi:Flp pilus assembly protein CpaB
MKSRSLVVAGALVLALLATAGVFLYVNNVKQEAETGGALSTVLVSSTDIAAGTDLNPLVDQGAFEPRQFPTDSVIQGAVTSVSQLRNRTTAAPILAGEQIALSRLSGTSEKLPGGVYGLQPGFEAVSVKLEAQQMIGRKLQAGDHVTLFGVFSELQAASGSLSSLSGKGGGGGSTSDTSSGTLPSVAAVVVPDARVVGVTTAAVDPSSTASQDDVSENQVVTLELTPEDGQKITLTQETGKVWLGLIRPGDHAPKPGPVTLAEVIGR